MALWVMILLVLLGCLLCLSYGRTSGTLAMGCLVLLGVMFIPVYETRFGHAFGLGFHVQDFFFAYGPIAFAGLGEALIARPTGKEK